MSSPAHGLKTPTQFKEKAYGCAICRDNGWLEISWCDGSGELTDTGKRREKMPVAWCGRSQDHVPHSFTPGRCECWQRKKSEFDSSRPADEPAKPRRRYA